MSDVKSREKQQQHQGKSIGTSSEPAASHGCVSPRPDRQAIVCFDLFCLDFFFLAQSCKNEPAV